MKYLLFTLLFFVSLQCTTTRPVLTNTIQKDTTIIREKPVIVQVPGASVQTEIDYDKIGGLFKKNKIIIREDKEGIARLTLYMDSVTGTWMARCEALEQQVETMEKIVEHHTSKQTEIIQEKQNTMFGDLMNKLLWVVAGFFVIQFLGSLLIRFIKPL